ncbi:MAG: RtcB family protein [Actinomycetota bacterium]
MAGYNIRKINDYKWEIPRDESLGMRVPAIVFADSQILDHAKGEKTLDQVINVATLPGIVGASLAMPDIHYGYGFPIGGVAAMDASEGVISPGGVGFDISCGVRILKTGLFYEDIKDSIKDIMGQLFFSIPKGVGSTGKIKLSKDKMKKLLKKGVAWAVENGYGWEQDIDSVEDKGCMQAAEPGHVSERAYQRGYDQLGTLGSGNHFLELQRVEDIYDSSAAARFGLEEGQVTVMIHSGSRGFGHQVCSDYIKVMSGASAKYNIKLADRQLACAPLNSDEGQRYYAAMACAVNYALANRHCLAHWVRQAMERYFKQSAEKLGMELLYDVSHNIAKVEEHTFGGRKLKLCVHRKGATRAFGPGSIYIPQKYRDIGQPVIIPGDMGRYSYILLGTEKAMSESFGSTCHGAGRMLSRTKAKKTMRGQSIKDQLFKQQGIVVMAESMSGLAEEAPAAYKDVKDVVNVAHNAGLSTRVLRLRPLGVLKG